MAKVFGSVVLCVFFALCWLTSSFMSHVRNVECELGYQTNCAEFILYTPDNLSQAEIDAWNANRGHHVDNDRYWYVGRQRRWSLSRVIPYDGETVRQHRFCIGMDYPETEAEGSSICTQPQFMSGKHIGKEIPNRYFHKSEFEAQWQNRSGW